MTDMDLLKVGNGYYLITMDSISNNFVVGNIGKPPFKSNILMQ